MDPTRIRSIMLEASRDGDWTLAGALARTLRSLVALGVAPRDLTPEDANNEAVAILAASERHLDPCPIGR
jgi:hypothetical protein